MFVFLRSIERDDAERFFRKFQRILGRDQERGGERERERGRERERNGQDERFNTMEEDSESVR